MKDNRYYTPDNLEKEIRAWARWEERKKKELENKEKRRERKKKERKRSPEDKEQIKALKEEAKFLRQCLKGKAKIYKIEVLEST
jgi:hypothetical protein